MSLAIHFFLGYTTLSLTIIIYVCLVSGCFS